MEPTRDLLYFMDDQLKSDIKELERELELHLESVTPLLTQTAGYLIAGGGKRIRPVFLIMAYRSVGGTDLRMALPICAAIEYIHTASLMHDDINDHSLVRRGRDSTHVKFGSIKALVGGDFLFVKAFEIGGRYDYAVIEIIAKACTKLAEGEILQNEAKYNSRITVESYLDIISRKTASLISACLEIGAFLGSPEKKYRTALRDLGENIGLAFQITDDILDIMGDEEETGKACGTDLREGQTSLPVLYALQELEAKDEEFLRDVVEKKENSNEEIEKALELIKRSKAVSRSYETAMGFLGKAKNALAVLPETTYRDHFELVVEYIVQRCC